MNKNDRKLVVCIGAQKAATTTLFSFMQKHSEVCTTFEKETGFFMITPCFRKVTNGSFELVRVIF